MRNDFAALRLISQITPKDIDDSDPLFVEVCNFLTSKKTVLNSTPKKVSEVAARFCTQFSKHINEKSPVQSAYRICDCIEKCFVRLRIKTENSAKFLESFKRNIISKHGAEILSFALLIGFATLKYIKSYNNHEST